jgi:hypothetical protein
MIPSRPASELDDATRSRFEDHREMTYLLSVVGLGRKSYDATVDDAAPCAGWCREVVLQTQKRQPITLVE